MEEQKPKRGCFLSGILWILTIFGLLGLIYNILARFVLQSSNPMDPIGVIKSLSTGMFIYSILASLIGLISYILILCWKKQGCYLLAIISVIGFIVTFITSPIVNMFTIGTAIIGFIISLAIAYFSYKAIEKREKFIREEA